MHHTIGFVGDNESSDASYLFPMRLKLRRHSASAQRRIPDEFGKEVFNTDANAYALRSAANRNFCQLNLNSSNKLQGILGAIHEEYRDKSERFPEVIKANFSILFMSLSGNDCVARTLRMRATIMLIFACGDNTTRIRTVANAVSMGTTAGMMVNKELILEAF